MNGNAGSPAWSPDNKQIAFGLVEGGKRRIYTMKADGSNIRGVLSDNKIDFYSPEWSPDGLQLLVVGWEVIDKRTQESTSRVYLVDLEQRTLREVPISSVYHPSIDPSP